MSELFGISDLHLPGGGEFDLRDGPGPAAIDRLASAWRADITAADIVLMPGDNLDSCPRPQARALLERLDALPGRKVLISGNHEFPDRGSNQQLRRLCTDLPTITCVVGTAARLDVPGIEYGLVVAGTCGAWRGMNGGGRMRPCFAKELRRMKSAVANARRLQGADDELVILTHYPPFDHDSTPTSMSALIESSGAKLCVYGHVHDAARWRKLHQSRHGKTTYRFVACDYLHGRPRHLGTFTRRSLRLS